MHMRSYLWSVSQGQGLSHLVLFSYSSPLFPAWLSVRAVFPGLPLGGWLFSFWFTLILIVWFWVPAYCGVGIKLLALHRPWALTSFAPSNLVSFQKLNPVYFGKCPQDESSSGVLVLNLPFSFSTFTKILVCYLLTILSSL